MLEVLSFPLSYLLVCYSSMLYNSSHYLINPAKHDASITNYHFTELCRWIKHKKLLAVAFHFSVTFSNFLLSLKASVLSLLNDFLEGWGLEPLNCSGSSF